MDNCICREALKRSFETVSESVCNAQMKDTIVANSEQLAKLDEKWMSLYRCRTCGRLWVEAWYFSGHVQLGYLLPAPPVSDPVEWFLNRAAEQMPLDSWD